MQDLGFLSLEIEHLDSHDVTEHNSPHRNSRICPRRHINWGIMPDGMNCILESQLQRASEKSVRTPPPSTIGTN